MKHTGAVRLETSRLILRPVTLNDAQAMFDNWASDPQVTQYLSWTSHQNVEQTKTIISSWIDQANHHPEFYQWFIENKNNHDLIGTITCFENGEIGYCIAQKYWHQGITSEALAKVLEYLFEVVEIKSVHAVHNVDNPNSGKVMLKCGLIYEKDQPSQNNQAQPITCRLYRLTLKQYKILKNQVN